MFSRRRQPDLDELLHGAPAADPATRRLQQFTQGIDSALEQRPSDTAAGRHVAAMTDAAAQPSQSPAAFAGSHEPARSRRARPAALAAKLAAAAVLVVSGLTGSLAMAGVSLPDPVRAVADAVGLPNQSAADDVRSVIEATPPAARDCEFGKRVSEAARNGAGSPQSERAGNACEQGTRRNADGADKRSAAARRESRFGQDTASRARELRTATPQQRSNFGSETAGRAREQGRPADEGTSAPRQRPSPETRPSPPPAPAPSPRAVSPAPQQDVPAVPTVPRDAPAPDAEPRGGERAPILP